MKQVLAGLRPEAVPLPSGTEVVTRVDKRVGDRLIKEGAIGRVEVDRGATTEVRIVGVGTLTYARDELVPRRIGQARYAERRAGTEQALTPCVVLEAIVGSRAWGLEEDGSDTDRRGIFALPFAWSASMAAPPGEIVSLDASTTYWELRKAFEQALKADPNTLETLFVESVTAKDEIGAWILEERQAFVSAHIYGSFGRYAVSQLKKLSSSLRLAEHKDPILRWLAESPDDTLDAVARRLAREALGPEGQDQDRLLRAKEYVKQLYRSLYDQGLLEERSFDALKRYAAAPHEPSDLPRTLRPKNAYNLLRLLRAAIEWLETGQPSLRPKGPLRERLLSIKRGEVELSAVLDEAEAMTPALEEARTKTSLPREPDVARVDRLYRRIQEEIARRHLEGRPGPLGKDAPPAPEPVIRQREPG
ncbi:MAG: nucleotidyltransferase domain-containing protein [Myxococcota bacterium]